MSGSTPCPNVRKHTKAPTDYIAWHEWAEKKAKTHDQAPCPECGRLAVWVKRKKAA